MKVWGVLISDYCKDLAPFFSSALAAFSGGIWAMNMHTCIQLCATSYRGKLRSAIGSESSLQSSIIARVLLRARSLLREAG